MAKSLSLKSLFFSFVKALRFLAFLEKDPRHQVANRVPLALCVAVSLYSWICAQLLFACYSALGFYHTISLYAFLVLAPLEAFHIVFDR